LYVSCWHNNAIEGQSLVPRSIGDASYRLHQHPIVLGDFFQSYDGDWLSTLKGRDILFTRIIVLFEVNLGVKGKTIYFLLSVAYPEVQSYHC
jgi:hypothetical protein